MDTIASLGSILGVSFLSGIRLYSTVLVVGLGNRTGLLKLPPELHLDALSSTPVLLIAGVIYLVEFVADKIPWVDSLWDVMHTVIRPLGAAVLAVAALGDVDARLKVAAFLLSGTVALSSHAAKASTRLVANHSPEPFTNAGLSVAEDGIVVGGVWLALTHPAIMLTIVLVLVVLIAWLVPKIVRLVRRNVTALRTRAFSW